MKNFKILIKIIFVTSLHIQLSQPDQGEMESKDNVSKFFLFCPFKVYRRIRMTRFTRHFLSVHL